MDKELQDIALYESIFQSSLDGIFVVDADDIIIKVNTAAQRLFGYNSGELTGKNIEILIPKKLKNPYKDFIKKDNSLLIKATVTDVLGLKKDKSKFPLEIILNPTIIYEKRVLIAFVTDITERKLAKEALSNSRFRMAEAQRLSHIGDWYWNLETNECKWSDEFYRICGLPPKDKRLNADTILNFIHPDDRKNATEILNAVLENNTPYQYKKRLLRPDGSIRNIVAEGTVIYDEHGKSKEMFGTMQDVTENELMHNDLNEINRKFTTLINNLQGIVFQCKDDEDWTMKYISDTCYAITGYTAEQFYSSNNVTWNAIIHPDDRNMVREKVHKAKAENRAFQMEYRIITANNEIKWIQESGVELLSGGNEEYTIEGYMQDITKKKETLEKLRFSQDQLKNYSKKLEKEVASRTSELTTTVQKFVASNLSLEDQVLETREAEKKAILNKSLFSAIAKNFPNGFIIVFDRDFKILLLEGEALKRLEVNTKAIKGSVADDIKTISEEQKTKLKQDIKKTIAGAHLSFVTTYKDKYYTVNTTAIPDEEAIGTNALFIYNDITAQKKSELQTINALKKEQELNELKSRFVSMASHEFRTPLSAIQTSAILIGKQNKAGQELKLDKYVNQIRKNVKHLDVILNDFLSLSMLEEGKTQVNKELFDVVSFSKTLVEELVLAKKEGQNMVLSMPDCSISLNLDRKLLRHILMNLLSNAIKYSSKHTDIHFKIEENNNFVTFIVKDQGIGISKEDLYNLFDRFFRAKNVQNIQGTGLGLHIVKQYVTLLDGTIDVESEVNKGTTFTLKWAKHNT